MIKSKRTGMGRGGILQCINERQNDANTGERGDQPNRMTIRGSFPTDSFKMMMQRTLLNHFPRSFTRHLQENRDAFNHKWKTDDGKEMVGSS